VNVPAVAKRNWKLWPGPRIPEFHIPPSATESCAIESLLVHVTVVPTVTATGFGTNAVVVSVRALVGIDTAVELPVVGGVVEGDELGEEELLHPATAERAATSRIRRNVILLLYETASVVASGFSRTTLRKPTAAILV
jgi:hypothetical protein